jgi:alpha-glucosidase
MLYALRGTPFIYQGEELGLPDAPIPPERVVDVDGRDPERAPIPWSPDTPGHGFTTGEAWLPFVAEASTLNAQTQADDPHSTLSLARAIARLRADSATLQTGSQSPFDAGPGVLAWTRELEGETLLAAVNFTADEKPLDAEGTLLLSSDPDRAAASASLGPSEALLLRCSP